MQCYLRKMTIFIQSFCSHQKAILFSPNGYKIFSGAQLIQRSLFRLLWRIQSDSGVPGVQPRNSISINASQTLTHKVEGQEKYHSTQKGSVFCSCPRIVSTPIFYTRKSIKLWSFGLKIWFEYIFLFFFFFRCAFAFLVLEKRT